MATPSCMYLRPSGLCSGGSPLTDEHYLQRALGKFRGYEPLRGKVCKASNERLSKLDEVLVRLGPEALLRAAHEISGRKRHRKKDVFHEGSHGYEPLQVNAWLPDDASPS